MDDAIPFGRWRFGLDATIGLVPGFGDALGALISLAIVARAVSVGVPKVAVARMVANIVIDALVGAIPFAGDAFDFAFKANRKNLRIYQESLEGDRRAELRHWAFFAALAACVTLALALMTIGTIALLTRIGKSL
jgi:hypothetical protein